MCCATETLEMLIGLHICLFLRLYDNSNMNFGDIQTAVLYNQPREMYYDLSLGKFGF